MRLRIISLNEQCRVKRPEIEFLGDMASPEVAERAAKLRKREAPRTYSVVAHFAVVHQDYFDEYCDLHLPLDCLPPGTQIGDEFTLHLERAK